MRNVDLRLGDCRDILTELEDASVDAILTDPPYELAFMGKKWDNSGIAFDVEMWEQCLRVLKPGGHLLAFGGSRTWHRLTVAIEDAGFEIRDSIAWLYGSGFPKSLNVSKAIDKAAGAEREVRQWQGWSTALKPSFEPIVVARKPLVGTVAANVLEHGTGALNIDACRVGTADKLVRPEIQRHDNEVLGKGLGAGTQVEPGGRWPTNVVLDETQAAELDAQSGISTSRAGKRNAPKDAGIFGAYAGNDPDRMGHDDSGGASRFFPVFKYQAKAPTKERPSYVNEDGAKVAHSTVKPLALMRWLVKLVTPPGGVVLDPFAGSGTTVEACLLEGFDCIAIENEADYIPLIEHRISRSTT
ncbi:DNA methylase [Mycobacterium phage Smeagol]|nr:DNA methylase [Mycobacterium phage Smeagol]